MNVRINSIIIILFNKYNQYELPVVIFVSLQQNK